MAVQTDAAAVRIISDFFDISSPSKRSVGAGLRRLPRAPRRVRSNISPRKTPCHAVSMGEDRGEGSAGPLTTEELEGRSVARRQHHRIQLCRRVLIVAVGTSGPRLNVGAGIDLA